MHGFLISPPNTSLFSFILVQSNYLDLISKCLSPIIFDQIYFKLISTMSRGNISYSIPKRIQSFAELPFIKLYKLGHPIEREILSSMHAHSQLSGVLSFKIGKNVITLTSYDTTHNFTRILFYLQCGYWSIKFFMIGALFLIFLET